MMDDVGGRALLCNVACGEKTKGTCPAVTNLPRATGMVGYESY